MSLKNIQLEEKEKAFLSPLYVFQLIALYIYGDMGGGTFHSFLPNPFNYQRFLAMTDRYFVLLRDVSLQYYVSPILHPVILHVSNALQNKLAGER